ncbi:interleukin-2 receptor subunit beta-like [Paroedura picta]|uniref:interleukin-2 receptor subunit beta-like n=1 Tax=Paroedura picta TaxID=143630 RepID=UPI004055D231
MESDRKPSYNLTWQLHKVSHYLEGQLEYEVAYKKLGSPDKAATILPIMYDQQWIEIENLSPDSEYEAAVRVKVQDYSGFKSLWSRWSTPLKWRTHPKERPSLSLRPVLLGFGISSIFILLIAAVLVKTRIPKWLQKVLKFHLPDPVMFFPSLTAVHEGDVQKWLSSPSSMDSFHITATSPEVSVLEVLQKGSQDPCLLLPKDCLTPTEAPETSGHSLSSCFINHGYFFFHHHHSLEVEPCKVYFTYDPFAQENSSSEDDDSYQALHTAGDHPSLPSDSLVGIKEDVLLLPEMKEPTQKVHQTISPPSMERSPPVLATEQAETQKESEAIFPVSIYLYQSSTGTSNIHKQPASNVNEMEAVTDVASHISTEDNAASFLQPVIPYPGKASDVCQTTSCSQVPNSEAYLSLRELQSQYSHQSA